MMCNAMVYSHSRQRNEKKFPFKTSPCVDIVEQARRELNVARDRIGSRMRVMKLLFLLRFRIETSQGFAIAWLLPHGIE